MAQSRVKADTELSFCVTLSLPERYFRLNNTFQFHETDLLQIVSSAYDPPESGYVTTIQLVITLVTWANL